MIFEKTMVLLKNSKESTASIGRNSGLTQRWVHLLKTGQIKDPSVRKIEILFKYLVESDK